ncbi:hypothetical protein PENTCL1PPCAC_1831 [Pristionchus entomophagus]|uniref:Uncharacterized protein n=1 Tax=Pristionchus entomophagus TaxID=358040 RepID=A0AAV5SJ29_9BILA|nr:hypothetical protein PENTCL1PPCAC_1831 [Pristionchus entomophagus]
MWLVSALLMCVTIIEAAQNIPFLELLNSESVAAQLSQQTAQQAARNEKEIMMRNEAPQVKQITLDQRPSEIFGQAFTNLARPLKMQTFDTVAHPELLLAPQGDRRRAPPAAAAAATTATPDASLHAALFSSSPARNASASEFEEDLTRIDDLEKEIRELRKQLEERKAAAADAGAAEETTTEKPKEKKKKRSKKEKKEKHAKAAAAKTAVSSPMKSEVSIDEAVQQAPASGATGNIFTDMIRAFGGSALMGAVMPKPQPQEQRGGEIEIRRDRMHGDTIFSALGNTPIQPELAAAAAPVRAGLNAAATPDVSPFMQLASAFLKGSGGTPRAEGVGTAPLEGIPTNQQSLPSIKEVVPMANENFGIPRGQGCLPFLGEFMQIAYGNCVKEADEAAYSTWSSELQSAVLSGKMDLLKASRESCKRGAEREQCNQLRQAISNCDIMDSLQVATSLQRNLKRCEEISGIVDQNPITVMSQIGNLVNGEFAHGFLNNFLGGR